MIINWEALRTHSRLTAFGSHALKKCVECGGSGTVKQAQCEVHERELNEMDYGAVVADEVHKAKDPNCMQTRALWAASGDAKIRFGLTGTPIANDPTELWPILHWVDEPGVARQDRLGEPADRLRLQHLGRAWRSTGSSPAWRPSSGPPSTRTCAG